MSDHATWAFSACTTERLRWHLIFTKPSGEEIARANLERQGYRVYLPRLHQRINRRGAWRQTISALFPRYLFVQINLAIQSLAPMRSTLGVAKVVRFGTEFISVPDSILEALMNSEDEAGYHHLANNDILKAGTPVRIVHGALAGLEGIFKRSDANERVIVLLNLLGRETDVRLPLTSVTAG